jgi:hypothetical protein
MDLPKNLSKGVDPGVDPGRFLPAARKRAARETRVDRDPSCEKQGPIGFLVPSKEDLSQFMARPKGAGLDGEELAGIVPEKAG